MPEVRNEEHDIQRLILSGYGNLPFGYSVLLHIVDPRVAQDWLKYSVWEGITFGGVEPKPKACLNVAFTYKGFEMLNLQSEALSGFSTEFREGPLDERRLRFMGDVETSAPARWKWGKGKKGVENDPHVHLLLLLYGESMRDLDDLYEKIQALPSRADSAQAGATKDWSGKIQGVELIQRLDAHLPEKKEERKEPFGFLDGIVQPVIRGRERTGHPDNTVAAGEFLLGYLNGRNQFPPSPTVSPEHDPGEILPPNESEPERKDFGYNGSYLVYRQLEQHVEDLWKWIEEAVGDSDAEATERLAAKMVGRWPDGAPLVLAPEADDSSGPEDQTEGYFHYASDLAGHRCPLGSHIRRSNPRDSLHPDPVASLAFSNLHRIIRRGRPYGPLYEGLPTDPSAQVGTRTSQSSNKSKSKSKSRKASRQAKGERGIHFLCFNADIASQFEFIQHDWINNPKFDGMLYADADPITGAQHPKHPERTGTFTVQQDPIRRQFKGLRRFVDVRGAGYFFMPGKRALKYLLSLDPA